MKSAFLVEVFNEHNHLDKRRIALSLYDADDWIERFAQRYDAQVIEDNSGLSGKIAAKSCTFTYKYTNVGVC